MGSHEEIRACLATTGCDGVMSSEAVLEYPALFHGIDNAEEPGRIGRLQLAREYLELAKQYPPDVGGQGSGVKCMKVHLHRFLDADLNKHTDIRRSVIDVESMDEMMAALDALEKRHADTDHDVETEQLSWYHRHRTIVRDSNGITVNLKTSIEAQREQESTVLSHELSDDAADCFACLFQEDN
jgi:tRNA-dihydrouridine synthase 1